MVEYFELSRDSWSCTSSISCHTPAHELWVQSSARRHALPLALILSARKHEVHLCHTPARELWVQNSARRHALLLTLILSARKWRCIWRDKQTIQGQCPNSVWSMERQAKSRETTCLWIKDKETRLYITQKLVVGFHPNLHQYTCRDLVHLFVYEIIIVKTQDEVP